MTIAFCDGFDSYASTSDLTKKWRLANSPWTWNVTAGRTGGGAIVAATTGGGAIAIPITSINTLAAVGFYFKASGPPASTLSLIASYNAGNALGHEMRLLSSGLFQFYDTGVAGSMLAGTVNICDGNWHWIEFAVISSAAGNNTFSAYVDGLFCGTNVIFAGSFTTAYWQFTSVAGITITIDDFIAWDLTVGPFTAFPINPRQITTTRPASDGTVTFGTVVGGTGTHASAVNETNPDGDTSYVQDGTSGDQDLYNYGALGFTPAAINAAVVNNYLKNPNAGTINFQTACKSNVTTTLGASTVTPSNYATLQTAYYTDPNGGGAWTAAGLNSAQFGIKVP